MRSNVPLFTQSEGWTIENEQCQKIGGRVQGNEVQILTVSLNGAQHFIYADPEFNLMKAERTPQRALASWKRNNGI
jgi:hypothetical protein